MKHSKVNNLNCSIIIVIAIVFKCILQSETLFNTIGKKAQLTNLSIVLFIYCFIRLFCKKEQAWMAYFQNIVFSFVILINIIFYRLYNDFITIGLIREIGQLGEVKQSIYHLVKWKDILLIC